MGYQWIPGVGPKQEALMRMIANSSRPSFPMGEAWFMGTERKMYSYLMMQNLEELEIGKLLEPLEAIASGTSCFGYHEEWCLWFDYLLPRLIPMALDQKYYVIYDNAVYELLVTALISQFPSGIGEEKYKGFREDVLNTLGSVMMSPLRWNDGLIIMNRILHHAPSSDGGGWGWWAVNGELSAALFCCLKYLNKSEIRMWAYSVFLISDPHWRSQVLVWLVGAHEVLSYPGKQPSDFNKKVPVGWAMAHCLKGNYTGNLENKSCVVPFIKCENRNEFLSALYEYITLDVLLDWKISIEKVEYLGFESLPIIEKLDQLYSFKER
ncbi:MAG: hypothetical protein V4507_06520 [Verrucomicrobiota bacterium]